MPIATVQLPNGKIADIEVPQGATPQDIESFVMSQPEFNTQQEQQPVQPSLEADQSKETLQEANLRRVGQFAKGIPQGLGNVAVGGVQALADIGEKTAQLIERVYFGDNLIMDTFGKRLAKQVEKRKQEQSQLPTSEKIGVAVGETLPFLTAGTGVGSKVAQTTGSKILGLATGGVVGGAEMSALSQQEQSGLENRLQETVKGAGIGGVVGGGIGVAGKVIEKGINIGEDIIKGYKARPVEAIAGFTNKPIETLDAVASTIKESSSNAYKTVREAGAILKPETTKSIFIGIDDALKESGILNPRLHGDTINILSDLKLLAKEKKGKIGLEELDQYRQLLNDVVKKNTDITGKMNADAFKSNIAINKLDDVVESLSENSLTKKDQEVIGLLKTARSEWKRYRKFDTITDVVRKADGDPNRIKTLLQNLVNNPKNLRGFNEAEKLALKNASRNSTGEGLLKAVGKFGFDIGSGRSIGNSTLPVGSVLLGGSLGSALATVGTISRQAQKLSARGKIEDVLKLIEGQQPEIASKVIQTLPLKTRNIVLTNILTKSNQ